MNLTEKNNDITKSPIFLVAPFFFLGTAMVVMKFIIPDTTPLFLAAARLLPAGIIILIVGAILKLPQPKTWKAWLWILLFSLVDGAIFQSLLTEGLVSTGAGIGAVLIDAQPLVVALLSRFLFGEIIGLWGWLGLTIGLIGISFCGLPEQWLYDLQQGNGITFAFDPQKALSGELLMLLSALSMSLGTIIVRYVKKHADPLVATGWHMIIGAIPVIILSALWETNQISNIQPEQWLGLSYITLFGTAATYGMFFYLAATGNVTSVSALIFLTPVFALLFSSFLLNEKLTQFQWIGVVLTLVSVYFVNQREQITEWVNSLNTGFGKATPDAQIVESVVMKNPVEIEPPNE